MKGRGGICQTRLTNSNILIRPELIWHLHCDTYGACGSGTNFVQCDLIDDESDTALFVHLRFALRQCASSLVISIVCL
jgi:hypothetical protein